MLVSACKKDKDENDSGQLKGKWEAYKRIEVAYKNGSETSRDTSYLMIQMKASSKPKGDSLFIYKEGKLSDEKYAFRLDGNELIFRSGSQRYFFAFKWYNRDQMSFTHDETSSSSTGVRRYTSETIFNGKQ